MLLLEFFYGFRLLGVVLSFDEICQLFGPLSFLFLFLLLCHLELFVTDPPEFCKVLVLLLFAGCFLLLSLDLKGPASLDGCLHIGLSLLLLLVKSVGSVLCLGDLSVEHLLFVVLELSEIVDLAVNHLLSLVQFCLESLALSLLFHALTIVSLSCKFFNLFLLFSLLQKRSLLLLHLVLVGFRQVSSHLSSTLLPLNFLLLLSLQVLLNLPLDQLSL